MTGSNRRPPRCKRGALPAELIARRARYSGGNLNPIQRRGNLRSLGRGAGRKANRPPWGGRSSSWHVSFGASRSIDGLLKPLACLELWLPRSGNMDPLAGPRVSALAGGPIHDAERAKAHQPDGGTAPQCGRDALEHAVDGSAGVGLGKTTAPSDSSDKIVFVHLQPPFS